MFRYFLILSVCLLISFKAHADQETQETCKSMSANMPVQAYDSVLNIYHKDYLKLKTETPSWQKVADVLFTLTLIVTLLGATITALQALPNSSWIKWLVAVIGIFVAGITYIKDSLPEGSYKTFQQARNKSITIEDEIDHYYHFAKIEAMKTDDIKIYIENVCKKVADLKDLHATYSTSLPPFIDYFITKARAEAPSWVNSSPQNGWIVSNGNGSSLSEAKTNAEQNGAIQISKAIQNLLDKFYSKQIYRNIGEKIKEFLIKMVIENDVYFDSGNQSKNYWIRYRFDEQKFNEVLSGISFPLTIFSTNLIYNKIEAIKLKLSEIGFIVSVSPAPRGPSSETNAIFVGEGVPIDAIKETVDILTKQGIMLKAIIYPWAFQKSKLPEIQKLNHLQIGGSSLFEDSVPLSQQDLSKLEQITTPEDMAAFTKEATNKVKVDWGLPIQ